MTCARSERYGCAERMGHRTGQRDMKRIPSEVREGWDHKGP